MKCPKCGQEIIEGEFSCSKCGVKFEDLQKEGLLPPRGPKPPKKPIIVPILIGLVLVACIVFIILSVRG